MEVQISYFREVGQNGNSMTLDQLIGEIVESANEKEITLTNDDDSVIAVCSNEEELRNALKEKGIE